MESSRSGCVLECGGTLVSGTDVAGTEEEEKGLIAPFVAERGRFERTIKNALEVSMVALMLIHFQLKFLVVCIIRISDVKLTKFYL